MYRKRNREGERERERERENTDYQGLLFTDTHIVACKTRSDAMNRLGLSGAALHFNL